MKKLISFTGILIFLCTTFLAGQTTTIDLSTPVPVDPDVRIGKLDNGMTYYIRSNHKPEKRVELRLAVNAGSILENDDQQGLAHFMEHMNFNGTKTFPKNELIDFLQKTGVKFGADINAYTSFDETVYMLQLPTDDSALVEKGYQVMEDWAHNAVLDNKEIDKERGVIIEEWRLGLGAQDRMRKQYFPVIFKDSKYADRVPIGKVEVLKNFKHDALRQFYNDWYRPDLQAIIVVGDINPDQAEARIKAHFSGIKNPVNEKARTSFDLPDNKDPLIAVVTDKEATNNMVLLFYKHPLNTVKTLGDFRKFLMAELFTGMINDRFSEIAQKPESPFIYAGSNYGRFLARTKDAYLVYGVPKENQIDKSLSVILDENERVRRFGFTRTELERQKEDMLSNYEKLAKEADKTESMSLTDDYVQNFLNNAPIPGAKKRYKISKNLMPGITLEEVNALAGEFVTDQNMAMVVMAPQKEEVKVPAKEDLLKIVRDSKTTPLTAYVDNFKEEPLVDKNLPEAKVITKKEHSDLNYTELDLSNGVRVLLKPTTFKNDEILVSAYSPGGSSLYPDDKYPAANLTSQIIDMSGAGKFDNVQLEKKLKGKNLTIHPYIDDAKEGFTGSASPKDFETLMQLIYLYFDSPRKDTSAYKAFMAQMTNQLKFIRSNPIYCFYDTLYKTAYPGSKRLMVVPSMEQLNKINLDDTYAIYKDRFSDAGDFTFTIVGNFNVDSITPSIVKYFGNLPSTGRKESWKNVYPVFAPGITNLTFNKGTDPQTMVGIVMSEPIEWNPANLLELSMLKEIISIKMIEVIREKLSGVYSPQIMLSPDHYPYTNYQMVIMFGCSPKMADKLTKAVFSEIGKIRKKGPTEVDLQKAKETMIRTRETDLEKNNFWLGKIESVYYDNTDPVSVMNFKDRVNAVSVDELQKAATKLIKPDHYVRVVLLPEEKK